LAEHHLVVVPHTHWDREWYCAHETFRLRLVGLLDRLLELLERDPAFAHFTLDGQTIVLEDYLEVRPGAEARLRALARAGRLLVGPWYVLPDEWLVSGEALIRNLRLGLQQASRFGGAMRLGYVPDQFGHVGQLPQIFAGFGFETAALWRGVGDDVDETVFWWEAPDGTRIFTAHLLHGYSNGVHLPRDAPALARRLAGEVAAQGARSRIPTLLLMNGSDHVEPDPAVPAALEAAVPDVEGLSAEIGTLPGYLTRARAEAPAELPVHRGELRSGLRCPLLAGCASTRLRQKQADVRNDSLLTHYLEPLSTWLEALGGRADPDVLALAWRVALQNHPHDSICGCSIDRVHEQMEARFQRVEDLARAELRRVCADLSARIAATPEGRGEPIWVWNPGASGPARAEGRVELRAGSGRRPRLHVVDASGRRIPAHAERVDPGGVLARYDLDARGAAHVVAGFPSEFSGLLARDLRWRRRDAVADVEVWLGEEPDPRFDFEAAKARVREQLLRAEPRRVRFRVHRLPCWRLRFVDTLPGWGLRAYRLASGPAPGTAALRAEATGDGGAVIESDAWRVEVAPDGRVRCLHRRSGVEIDDAVRLVSEGDRGDEYSFDPVPGDPHVDRPERARVRLLPGSEAEVGVAIEARYRVPAGLTPDRAARSRRRVPLPARIELRLAAGLDRLDLCVEVDHAARDHRLRVHLRAPFRARRFEVESAFEVAARPIAPQPGDFGSPTPAEFPDGATPQRSFATLRGSDLAMTVANRGAPEAEAVSESDGGTSLALTLLRAVGWLSRDDLARRPGHAGPAIATPGAQAPGRHRLELSWRVHAPEDPQRIAEAHRFAHPPAIFRGGSGSGAVLSDGARLLELDDPALVVSAVEPRPAGVRLWNASDREREIDLRWGVPGAGPPECVDLRGQPTATAGPKRLRPWQIVSLRPRAAASAHPHAPANLS
jgi:hypothetical protein